MKKHIIDLFFEDARRLVIELNTQIALKKLKVPKGYKYVLDSPANRTVNWEGIYLVNEKEA
jgi:hypothetical protein